MSLFVIVVFQAGQTKVSRGKKFRDTGNRMVMAIVDQVEVDALLLVCTRTGDEFISQSSAHHHHSNVQGFLECLYIYTSFKLGGRSKGTPASRLRATARFLCSFLVLVLTCL